MLLSNSLPVAPFLLH